MTDTSVDVTRDGTTAILRIHGEITGGSEPPIMAAYNEAEGARSIVLDFSQLDYMNSGGIGLLVTLLVRTQRAGQKLLAVGLSEHYRQILALTRLDEAIAICDDESTALAAAASA
jgi:anti-sigma B factor antagonist